MDKKSFQKFKKTAILIIAVIFLVQKSFVYFQEKKETNEIVFYTLPSQSQTQTVTRQIAEAEEDVKDGDETERETPEIQVSKENEDKININTASAIELQKLYRIGPAISERIIEYRQSYGDFETIEEIKEVKGIGDKKLEQIKDQICVK